MLTFQDEAVDDVLPQFIEAIAAHHPEARNRSATHLAASENGGGGKGGSRHCLHPPIIKASFEEVDATHPRVVLSQRYTRPILLLIKYVIK